MKLKLYPITGILMLSLIPALGFSQVQGNVFRDLNANGTWDNANPIEPGEYNIKVNAFNAANSLLATTATNPVGHYVFSAAQIPSGTAVRIQFVLPGGNFSAKRTGPNGTNVQFVTAGPSANTVDFALSSKKLLAGDPNPYMATTAATNGNALVGGNGNAGDEDNLMVFPYDLSNDGGPTRRTKNQYLGSVFGMAWQRESRMLFLAAYLKRHVSFGPNGIGAIYKVQVGTDGVPAIPSLLVDVKTIGIDVGNDPRSVALPGDPTQPNTDAGVFAKVGKLGIGDIEISENGRDLYIVNMKLNTIHRINIGNPLKSSITASDVTGTWAIPNAATAGEEFHAMAINIHEGNIFVGGVVSKQVTTAHDIDDTANLRGIVYKLNIGTGVFTPVLTIPFSYRRGFTNTDYRYEFRNNYWSAWQNNGDVSIGGPIRSGLIGSLTGSNATGIYYPQPMISKIQFDVDGSMVLGIRDRFGDQAGYQNLFETGNVTGETYRALSSGEILRAGKTGIVWTLENGGSVTSNGITTTTPGLTPNNPSNFASSFIGETGTPWGGTYGPGGGYYYYNHNFDLTGVPSPFNTAAPYTSHYVKCDGGLAIYPGYNELIMTAIDPMNHAFANGLIKNVNLGVDAGNMSGRMELLTNPGNKATHMGKACALGDVEVLLDAQAVELGNRVWDDLNANGRQDANEPGIAGVIVTLRSFGADGAYKTADDQVWTVTTDANGNYFFDETIVNDNRRPSQWIGVSATNSGILPGFEYRLEVAPGQAVLTGKLLSPANAAGDASIDNDAVYNLTTAEYIVNPGGSTASSAEFENDYNIDFGFTSNNLLLSLKKIELSGGLSNDIVNLTWKTTQELQNKMFVVERSTDGKSFREITNVASKGDGDFQYNSADNISENASPVLYYRVKVIGNNGLITYSSVIKITQKLSNSVVVFNNPFSSSLTLQITADKHSTAEVKVINAIGQTVLSQNQSVNAGVTSITVANANALPSGQYFLDVTAGSLHQQQKVLKQ
jgi:trimeric autotransporter adhesin